MSYINEIQGKRFGILTVIGKVNVKRRWEALCKCDCGNEKVVSAKGLVRGDTKSCGCQTNQLRSIGRSANLLGKSFGKLQVVAQGKGISTGRLNRYNNSWICKCECGGTTEASSNSLLSGNTTSCGCGRADGKRAYELRVTGERSIAESVMQTKQLSAARRGIEWSLTEEEFDNIVTKPCEYCGVAPQYTVPNVSQKKYHGLDRVDSSKGYIYGNVVACCKHCNFAKAEMSVSEFDAHIVRIYKHRQNKNITP